VLDEEAGRWSGGLPANVRFVEPAGTRVEILGLGAVH
jgi:hypothetical protein